MAAERKLEIRPLLREEPLAQINLGEARIIQAHKTLVYVVKLQEYKDTIEQLERTLTELVEDSETRDLVRVLQNKLQMIKNRLEAICPRKRKARGLINGLGSVVESITGNLDAEDAEVRRGDKEDAGRGKKIEGEFEFTREYRS